MVTLRPELIKRGDKRKMKKLMLFIIIFSTSLIGCSGGEDKSNYDASEGLKGADSYIPVYLPSTVISSSKSTVQDTVNRGDKYKCHVWTLKSENSTNEIVDFYNMKFSVQNADKMARMTGEVSYGVLLGKVRVTVYTADNIFGDKAGTFKITECIPK